MGNVGAILLANFALKVFFRQTAGEIWPHHQKIEWINNAGSAYFAEDSFADATKVKVPGLMLGITTQTSCETNNLTVAHGDTLLFLSDGILDVLPSRWVISDCHESVMD